MPHRELTVVLGCRFFMPEEKQHQSRSRPARNLNDNERILLDCCVRAFRFDRGYNIRLGRLGQQLDRKRDFPPLLPCLDDEVDGRCGTEVGEQGEEKTTTEVSGAGGECLGPERRRTAKCTFTCENCFGPPVG